MNPSRRVFDALAGEYDRWFDGHREVWEAQLRMLRPAVPRSGRGLELGVGSGRFAGPLGIRSGIDPSRGLLALAQRRGIAVVQGEGEHLPYRAGSFDYVLMMTVICYLDDPAAVFREVFRVLSGGGVLVAGFIERNGEIARQGRQEGTAGRFLRYARFPSAGDVKGFCGRAGFSGISVVRRDRGFCVMSAKKER